MRRVRKDFVLEGLVELEAAYLLRCSQKFIYGLGGGLDRYKPGAYFPPPVKISPALL
jgi:hypothetical protein